jgi:hypothetical protein
LKRLERLERKFEELDRIAMITAQAAVLARELVKDLEIRLDEAFAKATPYNQRALLQWFSQRLERLEKALQTARGR